MTLSIEKINKNIKNILKITDKSIKYKKYRC